MSDPLTIKQYCSVCKMEYEMSIVPTADGDDDGVVWMQCPNCKGYLPKMSNSPDLAAARGAVDGESGPDGESEAAEPLDDGAADAAFPADVLADAGLDLPEPLIDDLDADTDGIADEPGAEPVDGDDSDLMIGQASVLDDMDIASGVAYRPWETYAVGDVIHHLAWDDYGVVLAKEILPGDRKVVKVHFANAGIVRLIEEDGSRP